MGPHQASTTPPTGATSGWHTQSLDLADVAAFMAGLATARDRAMVLAMLLGGLRSAEVRSLRRADVDQGLRRVRVVGKGGKERVVPVDGDFFAETSRYLREERPQGAELRSVSWCSAVRPAGSRWERRRCGGSSAPTGTWPALRG